jgi:hypothetical protein
MKLFQVGESAVANESMVGSGGFTIEDVGTNDPDRPRTIMGDFEPPALSSGEKVPAAHADAEISLLSSKNGARQESSEAALGVARSLGELAELSKGGVAPCIALDASD